MRWGIALWLALLALPAGTAAAQEPPAPGVLAFSGYRCEQGGVPLRYWPVPPGQPPNELCRPSIFRVNADGTDLRRLTNGAAPEDEDEDETRDLAGDRWPSWSPDGTRIVFERHVREEGRDFRRLFVMDSDGSDERELMPAAPDGYTDMGQPAWSPRGDAIAFHASSNESGRALERRIYVVRPDGTAPRALSAPGLFADAPAFTPLGDSVVYFSSRIAPDLSGEFDYAVLRTTLDGSRTERLAMGDMEIARNGLSFSPDGQYVAVTGGAKANLFTIRADGTDIERRSEGFALNPTWSPIGPTLFWSGPYNNDPFERRSVIFRRNLAAGGEALVTQPAEGRDEFPSWNALGASVPDLPVVDDLPPAVVVGPAPAPPAPPAGAPKGGPPAPPGSGPRSKIRFLAFDVTGLRRIHASIGRRVRRGCRFVSRSGRLGRRRSCGRPAYARVKSTAAWRKRTARLPRGRYVLRFRTRDAAGNVTRRPRVRRVTVR